MSPTRAKEHQLEDESRRAFADAVPGHWVVRDVQKDYGIDTEVEIFAEDGGATGLTFKVQLKGTQTLHERRPHRSIKTEHLSYWQTLDSPVLVVLYIADSKQLYCKWSFAHDPGPSGYSKKTTTFSFGDIDLLANRIPNFESEVVLYRQLASGWVPHIVPLRIDSSSWGAVAGYRIVRRFRERLLELGLDDVARITTDDTEPSLLVRMGKNTLRISMPLDAGSMSLHHLGLPDTDTSPADSVNAAIDNTLIGLAALLATRDRAPEVLRILTAVGPCDAWFHSEISSRLSGALIEAGRTDIGVDIAKYLSQSHADNDTLKLASLYLTPAQMVSSDLAADEREELIGALRALSVGFANIGENLSASNQRVNIASIYSGRGDYQSAVEELQAAHADSPQLLEDPTFTSILAGNAFRAGMPALSADMYSRVVDQTETPTPQLLAYYADALLGSGQYRHALETINGRYGLELSDYLSVVNKLAVEEIIETLGIDSQQIRELTDGEIAQVEADPTVALGLLRDGGATQYGLWMRFDEDFKHWSLGRAALLARLNLKAAPMWALATDRALSERGRDSSEFKAIVEMGVTDASDEYLSLLAEASEASPDDAHMQEVVEYAHRIALNTSAGDGLATYGVLPSFD